MQGNHLLVITPNLVGKQTFIMCYRSQHSCSPLPYKQPHTIERKQFKNQSSHCKKKTCKNLKYNMPKPAPCYCTWSLNNLITLGNLLVPLYQWLFNSYLGNGNMDSVLDVEKIYKYHSFSSRTWNTFLIVKAMTQRDKDVSIYLQFYAWRRLQQLWEKSPV